MSSLRFGGMTINPSVVIADNNEATISITENGLYVPAKGYTGFAQVVVDIASKIETIDAINDMSEAVVESAKVWLNKVEGVYHIVNFAQATVDSTVGSVTQAAASGGTAKVSILVEGRDIDLTDYSYSDPYNDGNIILTSYNGANPDVVIPNV